ncbi:hypothetical protein [Stieleria varia]|uniref:Chromosome partition protein Smc n=1 Tax=Stieleria varia TaxID=2528005 RepID=A0A5C5ZZY9_9BACT|nr:hypothetical protein [Stieleria varia]TWT92705.1 hypothetical protein Pla52n_60700 [Stieleria varia]
MFTRPFELFRQINAENVRTKHRLDAVQRSGIDAATRMRRLAKQRSNALVELARHYLPELNHQSMQNSWAEVREKVRDLLLQKNDRRRMLREELQQATKHRLELEHERESAKQSLHHERVVLSCKLGNYRKVLRDDPAIRNATDEIAAIDVDIECCLTELERTNECAKRNLPAYEQCHLFNYLIQQNYGTPQYLGRGLQRRWDRWVAKLINFDNARSSFEHLHAAPAALRDLIEKKQRRYRELLSELESARRKANEQHGVQQQQQVWEQASERLARIDEAIESTRRREAALSDDLYVIDNIKGEFYEQAIAAYQRFLSDLEPDILKIYAACTDSPIDDEICARVRGLQAQIDEEQEREAERAAEKQSLNQYLSGLTELRDRMKDYLRATPADVAFNDGLIFGDLLAQMRQQRCSPGDVWRTIRRCVVQPKLVRHWTDPNDSPSREVSPNEMLPLQATFSATAESDHFGTTIEKLDREGVILPKDSVKPEHFLNETSRDSARFVVAAVCRSEHEATDVAAALSAHGVDSFTFDPISDALWTHENLDPTELELPESILVMVRADKADDARRVLVQRRTISEAPWKCHECGTQMLRGYGVCSGCGARHRRHD